MPFMGWIINKLNDLADVFFSIYLEVNSWVYPFWLAAASFWNLSNTFSNLAWDFYQFSLWIDDVVAQLTTFITEFDVWTILETPISWASTAWNWVINAPINILAEISSWWVGVSSTVQGWIDSAIAGVQTLINQVSASLGSLRTEWDNFWTLTWPNLVSDLEGLRADLVNFLVNILPGLATWSGIQDLVNTTLTTWFPFYDDLVEIWADIALFFTNPLDYLAARLESWFWESS